MTLRLVTLAVTFAFAWSAGAAPVPKGEKSTAEKLVGRWELAKSRGKAPFSPHYVIFGPDGVMTLEVGAGEGTTKYKGRFKVVDNSIDYELDMNGEKKAEKLAIKSFEKNDLITTDPEGIEEEFKRVVEKEK